MFAEGSKNKFQHNPDGTTFIFLETKNKYFPGKHTAIIDTEDWDKIKAYRWHLHGCKNYTTAYVRGLIPNPDKDINRPRNYTLILLHRLILGKPSKGMVTDHINHNGLDNRKENLRFATRGQNQQNRRAGKNSSSQYLGVSWLAKHQLWQVMIKHNGKRYYLGSFRCEHQAALAYNKKAIELHGEFANLNVVPEEYIIKYNNV